jgi:hypothetical protein
MQNGRFLHSWCCDTSKERGNGRAACPAMPWCRAASPSGEPGARRAARVPGAAAGVPDGTQLSLEPEFRRGHGALYDALAAGRVDDERLFSLLTEVLPPLVDGPEAQAGTAGHDVIDRRMLDRALSGGAGGGCRRGPGRLRPLAAGAGRGRRQEWPTRPPRSGGALPGAGSPRGRRRRRGSRGGKKPLPPAPGPDETLVLPDTPLHGTVRAGAWHDRPGWPGSRPRGVHRAVEQPHSPIGKLGAGRIDVMTQMVSRKRDPALGLATATGAMTTPAAWVVTRLTSALSNWNAAELSSSNAAVRPDLRRRLVRRGLRAGHRMNDQATRGSAGAGEGARHRRARVPTAEAGVGAGHQRSWRQHLPMGRGHRTPGRDAHCSRPSRAWPRTSIIPSCSPPAGAKQADPPLPSAKLPRYGQRQVRRSPGHAGSARRPAHGRALVG